MKDRLHRLTAILCAGNFSDSEAQDIRDAMRLMELAEAWHREPTQRNVASLSSHIKSLQLTRKVAP